MLADEGTELTQITAFVGLLLAKQDTELRQNYSVTWFAHRQEGVCWFKTTMYDMLC